MTVAEQLTKAVNIVKTNGLTNPRISVRCADEVHPEFEQMDLLVNNPEALRGLEVWITDHNGHIAGVIGDHEDGRKNVTFAM